MSVYILHDTVCWCKYLQDTVGETKDSYVGGEDRDTTDKREVTNNGGQRSVLNTHVLTSPTVCPVSLYHVTGLAYLQPLAH